MRRRPMAMSTSAIFRKYHRDLQTDRWCSLHLISYARKLTPDTKESSMSADDLRAEILRTFEAIASALKDWFKAISSRFAHREHDREYVRTVPGSTVESDINQQHVVDLFGE